MDIFEFVKAANRLCKNHACKECPAVKEGYCMIGLSDYLVENIEETVSIVEQWAKDHPVKTRQSEFLEMFPNAKTRNGIIALCPQDTCENYEPEDECDYTECALCRKKYWLTEITDND